MSELRGPIKYGWALTNSLQQKCARCGGDLEIAETGIYIRSHYSFLTAKTYKIIYLISYENKERREDYKPKS
jgi:hypothetical protein